MAAAATKKSQKEKGGVSGKTRKRAKKDPNAPKRAMSSYMFFAQDKRRDIVKSQPSLQKEVATVSKMIGEMWSKLTDKDKAPYAKLAESDKMRYEREKATYLKNK